MDTVAQFLQHAGLTMTFYRDNSAHPYLMGAGLVDAYYVTLVKSKGEIGNVIALVDNQHRNRISRIQLLVALGRILKKCPTEIQAYKDWTYFVLTKDAESFDAQVMRKNDECNQHYLQERYTYLVSTRDTLVSLLDPQSYDLLTDFLFRYVIHDWPWNIENKKSPAEQ